MTWRSALLLVLFVTSLLAGALVLRINSPVRVAELVPARTGMQVDLNSAQPSVLALLPGIGPGLAQRIVEHRERVGGFKSVEEIEDVTGIGSRTAEKLLPYVKCGALREK